MQCSIESLIVPTSFRVLEDKSSASKSIIAFGNTRSKWLSKPKHVAFKFSFPDHKQIFNDNLRTEIEMYREVSRLIKEEYTPNIVLFVDSWECTVEQLLAHMPEQGRVPFMQQYNLFLLESLEAQDYAIPVNFSSSPDFVLLKSQVDELQKKINDLLEIQATGDSSYDELIDELDSKWRLLEMELQKEKIVLMHGFIDDYVKLDRVNVLMTEQSQGLTLGKALLSGQLSEDQLFSALFQAIYTLYIFSIIGIRQGDLHLDNIFLDKAKAGTKFAYFINSNTYYLVPVDYVLKIYDWDYGSIVEDALFGFTPITIEECQTAGCGRNSKAEMYKLLTELYSWRDSNLEKYPLVKQFVEKVVNINLLLTRPELCIVEGFDQSKCPPKEPGFVDLNEFNCTEKSWEPLDCWILSPLQSLQLPEFNKWRRILTSQRPRLPTQFVYGLSHSKQFPLQSDPVQALRAVIDF